MWWRHCTGGSKQATEGINGAVERWCAGALHVGEGPSSQRIAKEASAFIAAFREAQKTNPTEFAWAAEIEGKAIFQSAKIASIELTSTNFTGGAHGGASSFLASFDLTNGHQLLKNEILSDTSAVLPMLAAAFAKQKSVADVREVIFPDLVFCLPANIAIVKEGVRFVYDPYEVAAWAVGGTDILLTWEQLGKAANPVWK